MGSKAAEVMLDAVDSLLSLVDHSGANRVAHHDIEEVGLVEREVHRHHRRDLVDSNYKPTLISTVPQKTDIIRVYSSNYTL